MIDLMFESFLKQKKKKAKYFPALALRSLHCGGFVELQREIISLID